MTNAEPAAPRKPTSITKPGRWSAASVTRARDASPHKGIIYGQPGVGKTHLLSTFPGLFFLHVEEGLKGASPEHELAHFPDAPRSIDEYFAAIDAFAKEVNVRGEDGKRPFAQLGIDSLSGLEALVNAGVCARAGVESMDVFELSRHAGPVWQRVQQQLDAVRRTGVHVWLIAHAMETASATTDKGDMFRRWDLAISGSPKTAAELRAMWRGWADHVLFLDWAAVVSKGGKGKRSLATYQGRVLRARDAGTHAAKSRSRLDPTIPATWEDLSRALAKGSSAPASKLRAEIEALLPELESQERAIVVAELDRVKSIDGLGALLSRAQGMLTVGRQDVEEAPAPAAEMGGAA